MKDKKNLQISADKKVRNQFFKIYLLLCSAYECLPSCMYVHCMCVGHPEEASYPLELELKTLCANVGPGN